MCPVLMVDYQRVDACSLKHLEVLTSVKAKYNLHIATYFISNSALLQLSSTALYLGLSLASHTPLTQKARRGLVKRV